VTEPTNISLDCYPSAPVNNIGAMMIVWSI